MPINIVGKTKKGPSLYTALQGAASFVLPETEGKPSTYQNARVEVTPQGGLNLFALDGKNLLVMKIPDVAAGLSPRAFYMTHEQLRATKPGVAVQNLLDEYGKRQVSDYALAGMVKQLTTIPPTLVRRVKVRRKQLVDSTSYIAGILTRNHPDRLSATTMTFMDGLLSLVGKLMDDGTEAVTRGIPSENLTKVTLPSDDSLWVGFNPEILAELVRVLDGTDVEVWAEPDLPKKPVLFKSENRMIFAMPASRKDVR